MIGTYGIQIAVAIHPFLYSFVFAPFTWRFFKKRTSNPLSAIFLQIGPLCFSIVRMPDDLDVKLEDW